MALYQYIAIDDSGRKIKGMVEADHEKEVEIALTKRSLVLTDLKLCKRFTKTSLSKKEVHSFTEELSKLIHAGLPLYNALTALMDKYQNHKIYPVIMDLADKIKRGKNFSDALSFHPENFDLIYCSMVANSEKTGALTQSLDELSTIMQRSLNLKKKVTSALLYPGILAVFALAVISCLIFFVVPSLFDLFEGRNLHPLTKIVFAVSKLANNFKGSLALGSAAFLILILLAFFVKSIQEKLFGFLLNLPIIKNLMLKISLIRFSRSFSVLLSTGISYIEALKLAKEVMRHPILKRDISYAEQRIVEGEKLSLALKRGGNIPSLVIRMLEIAEESGKTSEMLNHIAKIYEDEVERSLTKLTGILQPVLLLILGVVVGFIVLSVLLPLTDVSSFVE
jgi:general secretion pathway protein F